jgi:hypothetical protein
MLIICFSLIVFGGPEVPFLYLYSSAAPQRKPTVEYHPRWQPI